MPAPSAVVALLAVLARPPVPLAPAMTTPPGTTVPAATTDVRYGITWPGTSGSDASLAQMIADRGAVPTRVVVLVHGLDDPGWMWRDMIPSLRSAGHVVARMEYPNDGPIGSSARLLADELAVLRAAGVERVDIVAHSMGGLVSREMLTRHDLYVGDGTGGDRYPAVDRLIMCGTPNHGSVFARLRGVSELKEHVDRALDGADPLMGAMGDGSGEAGDQLLPGSTFLRALNTRPLPDHTTLTIIAGRMSPVSEDDVADLGREARRIARRSGAPRWLRDVVDRADRTATRLFREAVRGVGDGCVTIDSARLPGVSDVSIVTANHVNLIVKVLPTDPDPPPAIPIVLERLANDVRE